MTDNKALFPFYTTLASDFLADDTTVTVVDGSILPVGPNEICIGAEEPLYITYESIDGNVITGVTRNIDSFTGDVLVNDIHVSTYLDMRDDVKEIQQSGLPNAERLAKISHLLGWNEMMDYWINSIEERDEETRELTGDKIYIKPDGTVIRFDPDDQDLYAKKSARYNLSYKNNLKVIW